MLVAWSYGGFIVTDYVRAYGERAIAGINLVGAAVCCAPTFDHIGPGFLENAAVAGRPTWPRTSPHPAFPRRVHRPSRSAEEDWSAALCWNMVVPPG